MTIKSKVILISLITPSIENLRGTSALPFHLMVERERNVDVVVYTFNVNHLTKEELKGVEQQLCIKIHCIPLPAWFRLMHKSHLLFLRVFFRVPYLCYIKLPSRIIDEVKHHYPDLIWIYGEELMGVVRQLSDLRCIHLGPDTESLYYYRMMGRRFVMNNALNYWKCALMYRKYARMERRLPSDRYYTYLAVGEEDVRHLQQLNPNVNARFLRHPHYEVNSQFIIHNSQFHQPKIKLLIAGQYDLYMQQEADLISEELRMKSEKLAAHYSITFLGKGWEKHVESLRQAGWQVEHIKFAPEYIEEICKHDIQITPIAIGTGTKGKVLDALANGLLVIGTPYALENIAVEHGVSCLEYQQAKEVTKMLLEIKDNAAKYEEMARRGQEAVHMYHDRKLLARVLFSTNK